MKACYIIHRGDKAEEHKMVSCWNDFNIGQRDIEKYIQNKIYRTICGLYFSTIRFYTQI
jgi:hypothetical protein